MKKTILAIAFSFLFIGACTKEDPPPSPQKPSVNPAPAEATPASPAEAAPATPAAPTAPEAKPEEKTAVQIILPAECETYLGRINTCIEKLGASSDAIKQSLEETREGWKQVPQDNLAKTCKQAYDAFEQNTKGLGC